MAAAFTEYPPSLTGEQRQYLLDNLSDWSNAHGLVVRPLPSSNVKDSQAEVNNVTITAPITLFPSLFPRSCFDQARRACLAYNELYSAIASDEAWLQTIVEELVSVDDFMHGLWDIHLKVKEEGYAQRLQLGLFRSDYMIHMENGKIDADTTVKQVEFNTIASSFGGLSTRVSQLHKYLHSIEAYPKQVSSLVTDTSLLESTSTKGLAAGLAEAHQAYGRSSSDLPTCVIFIVQDGERNAFDQRHLEYELNTTHKTRTFRVLWDSVLDLTEIDNARGLIYRPPHDNTQAFEVSTVYFRAGYSPDEYNTLEAWQSRLQIERSRAIKCPSVLLQLAGTKKVQQVLATPESPHLAKFLPDKASARIVESTFAPIYPMDKSAAGLQARKLALNAETAQRYVLKPQREGGGNNIYRAAIPEHLKSLSESAWPAYILMEMIEPPAQRNVILRNGTIGEGDVICELGIYGACLWEESDGVGKGVRKVLKNSDAGYLLRTKGADSSEGGVAAGFGSIDSPLLVDV